MEWDGKTLEPGQGNNMYVFPGIGLGAILSKAVNVTQDMIYASGVSLSAALNEQEKADGWLYPDIRRIREVSVTVTRYVIRAAQQNGVDRELALRNLSDADLEEYIRHRMYDPFKEKESYLEEISHLVNGHARKASGGAHL
jgi:malate dehydrogenase (oxaloacetate-decarboxylating)(NADP+)